jgi:hypothetical protein
MASLHSGADIACGVFILVGKEGPAGKREGRVSESGRRGGNTIPPYHMIGLGQNRRVQNAVVVGK